MITEIGKMMAKFPLDPRIAKMIISAPKYNCTKEIITLAAMLIAPNPIIKPEKELKDADRDKYIII